MAKKRTWSETQLKEATGNSRSIRQVLIKLGLRDAGGNYAQINKYIKELTLDISHFKGQGWSRGMKGLVRPVIPLDKILIKNSDFQIHKLKRRLFVAGLKPEYCEQCTWAEKTSDGYLPLELDHINGNRYDNRLDNLRILCPNCHSLTPSYRGRVGKGKRLKKRLYMPGW